VRCILTCLRCGAHITTTTWVGNAEIAAVDAHLREQHPDFLPADKHRDFAELLGQVRVKMGD